MKHLGTIICIISTLLFLSRIPTLAQARYYHFEQAKDMTWGSRTGQVYKIPKDSVYDLMNGNTSLSPYADWMQRPFLQTELTQFDSLLATSEVAPGYYVIVYATQNQVHYKIKRKAGLHASLIKLHNKEFIEVKDAEGRLVKDASISYKGKPIAYNELMQAYPVRLKRKGLLTVSKGADIAFLNTYAKRWDNGGFFRGPTQNKHYSGYAPRYAQNNTSYKGYLVTNKPNYLPQDTIKYKAYLLDAATNEPVTEPLDIYIEGRQKTSFIHPSLSQGPGLYFSEFVLGDSILPGQSYSLMVKGRESQAVYRQTFKVEDYLLDDTYLRVNTENLDGYQQGDSIHLYAYAYNANGLPLIDATLDLYVRPGTAKFREDNPDVFIPDTLFHKHVEVAMEGDTYIGFATDSLPFLDSLQLMATVRLRNANNEIRDTTFLLHYNSHKSYLKAFESNDKIKAEMVRNKQTVSGKGFYHRNGVFRDSISYPCTLPVDYTDLSYTFFETDDTGAVISRLHHNIGNDQVQIREAYFKDTAYFELLNPQETGIRYALYEGNKFLYYGYTNRDTLIKQTSKKDHTFTLIASYNWRNQALSKQAKAFKLKTKMLIDIDKKDIVFPGQKDSIHIALKDPDDKGIPNTNVTVLAFNSKFKEDFTARLESSGYVKPGLASLNRYSSMSDQSRNYLYRSEKIHPKWAAILGVDTSFFYSRIYQDTSDLIVYSFNIEDKQYAQVAVYVKEEGNYVQPDLIYLDNRLAYIRTASISTDPDALLAEETVKQIRFRSAKGSYSIQNVVLKKGTKTNIFINGDSISTDNTYTKFLHVNKVKEQDSLNYFERQTLANALFTYKSEYGIPFLVQQKEYLFISDRNFSSFNQLKSINRQSVNRQYTIGPVIARDSLLFFQQGNVKMSLVPELNFSYSLRPGMMRMLQQTQSPAQQYNYKIPYIIINPSFNRVYKAAVNTDTLKILRDDDLFPQPDYSLNHILKDSGRVVYIYTNGNLTLLNAAKRQVKTFILVPENNTQQAQIFNGFFERSTSFKADTGRYSLFIIWADTGMSRIPRLHIKANGRNIYNLDLPVEKLDYTLLPEALKPYYKPVNTVASPLNTGTVRRIKGMVIDNQGEVLTGATILLSGTDVGVAADENGLFSLDIPLNNQQITVAYYGCLEQDIKLDARSTYYITLQIEDNPQYLEGVLVYGQKIDRRSYTGALQTVSQRPVTSIAEALNGTAPGLLVISGGGQPGTSPDIRLRCTGSIDASAKPLIVLNGAPFSGDLSSIKPEDITSLEVLKEASAKAVYGARAANGVILIETKSGKGKPKSNNFLQSQQAQDFIAGFMDDMQAASGIRSDFRDWAIWEPNLWTDKAGKLSFEAHYPGTATSWKTYVLAMNPKGFAASALYTTKSFKPLSATLALPRFLRYGDTVEAVGNVVNYTGTPFSLKTHFKGPELEQSSDFIEVKTGKTEKASFAAPANNTVDTGSVQTTFSLETANGFLDGEARTIPVIPVGVIERKGIFTAMEGDTSFSTQPDPQAAGYFTGKTTISIDGSLIDVMMQEIENLKEYPHGCTEQITSKLLSIHYEEVLKKLMGRKDFNNTRTKRVIINKIAAAQNRDGSFGWFANNSGDIRVSNYVLNALMKINTDGNLNPIINEGYNFLQNNLKNMDTLSLISSLATLSQAQQKAAYAFYVAGLDTAHLDYYNKFALLKIKKEQGFDYKNELDTLLKKANVNEQGLSWGKESYDWYRNQLATTLLAYQIIENDTMYAPVKKQIIDYLLLKRNKGYYRNTAESGLVLSTLLPGLIKDSKANGKNPLQTKVRISGSHREEVQTFPKRIVLNNKEVQLNIQKEGLAPAYVSVNYEFFNPDAKEKQGTFIVKSTFKTKGDTLQQSLKHGEQLKLLVQVTVTKDAEYVLIDVPIPAGCVPLPKSTTNPYEASRADFKDKTSIYCNTLPKGIHYFEIEVQARFKGSFQLSPASASMMYFPDEQGNTAVKRIEIR